MSLRLKTILGIAAIEAVLLIILISSVLNYMRASSEESLAEYANTTATLFSTTTKDAILSFDLASLESFVSEILKNKGVLYARVLDASERVLAQGGDKNLLATPFKADINLDDVTDNVYDSFAEVREGGGLYGRVEIGISIDRIHETIEETRELSATIALVEMILVAIFSFTLGLYLTRQLQHLRVAAKQISEGNFDHKVPVRGKDELAEVAQSFNKMSQALKASDQSRAEYQQQLEILNAELEDRVQRRTEQLSKSNTKLKVAYEELQSTQARLLQSEKMASLGQMAAGVAHEINNPIAFVNSNFSTLRQYIQVYKNLTDNYRALVKKLKQQEFPEFKEALSEIEQYEQQEDINFINDDAEELISDSTSGINRVKSIVQGLKNFSHVDQAEQQEADINQCIEETLKMARVQIKDKCTINKNLQPLPPILCNPGKLNQVFMNLIINADQAIDEQGEIHITTHLAGDEIVVTVEDSGKGVASEHLSKLFDPFFTTKPVGEGTGLGLSISHGIIEEHNGTIDIKSELGKGARFLVRLPVNSAERK